MSDTPSENKNNNRRRNNYRKRNNNRRRNNQQDKSKSVESNDGQVQAKSNSRPNNRNNNRRQSNKNRRPKTLSPAKTLQKYDNLLEQYLVARKKYFDIWGRGKDKQLQKVERNYQQALQNLRKFETDLLDWQKEVLTPRLNAYPEDRQYSKSREVEPTGDIVSFVGEFEDPHLLPTQKASNWATDTEESTGSIEDYQRYKDGIIPQ